ncbi:MAG: hypothetical protein D6798_03780 [Deltaproteobacteria bacterium]|nr:MAG: hypothetical protein D6798_03780 [Deltaproteobacteria bacterium]
MTIRRACEGRDLGEMSMTAKGRVAAVVLVGLLLRLLRLPPRWSVTAWLYAAYPADTVQALRDGRLGDALTTMTGLHPPLWPLLHAISELLAPVPLIWLLTSVLASTLAVFAIARVSPLAGLLLAVSPLQLAYAAEVNDYPLAVALVSAALALRATGRGGIALGIVGALAAWTHALAGLAVGLVVLTLPGRQAIRGLGIMAAGVVPLVPGGRALLADPGSFRQPPFKPALVLGDLGSRFGWIWLCLIPAAVASRRCRWAWVPLVGTSCAIAALIAARIAAPHQFPYWLLVEPFLVVLAARRWRALSGGVILVHLGVAVIGGLRGVQQPPGERGIDRAMAALQVPWTCVGEPSPACSGDALFLLFPRVADDDDKRPTTPSLWRLRPWWSMPAVRPYDFDWGDHRHGQPRLVPLPTGRHVVYVDDYPRDELAAALAAHPRLWIVVPSSSPDRPLARHVAELTGRVGTAVGGDLVFPP